MVSYDVFLAEFFVVARIPQDPAGGGLLGRCLKDVKGVMNWALQ